MEILFPHPSHWHLRAIPLLLETECDYKEVKRWKMNMNSNFRSEEIMEKIKREWKEIWQINDNGEVEQGIL